MRDADEILRDPSNGQVLQEGDRLTDAPLKSRMHDVRTWGVEYDAQLAIAEQIDQQERGDQTKRAYAQTVRANFTHSISRGIR